MKPFKLFPFVHLAHRNTPFYKVLASNYSDWFQTTPMEFRMPACSIRLVSTTQKRG